MAINEIKKSLNEEREYLKNYEASKINSADEAEKYIVRLAEFRKLLDELGDFYGANYRDLIREELSRDLYSDQNRFLYELVQNVDDCEYKNPSDCRLTVKFDLQKDRIILNYNEVGFTPFNVFAITGIAEEAKNVDSFKQEIGEKGIGFKSVFGVADKVFIQSGWFSFEIKTEQFIVPVPRYENFEKVEGTRLTLHIPDNKVFGIYRELANRYCDENAIFNNNPLLFLNKLTRLDFIVDKNMYMKFSVNRPARREIAFAADADLSVELYDYKKNDGEVIKNSINCLWFAREITYNKNACIARYGGKTKLTEKVLYAAFVVPKVEDIKKVKGGTLYSYFPTRINLKIPAAVHAPFKLVASREYVDPQGDKNPWFTTTCNELKQLLYKSFTKLADIVKADIVRYLSDESLSIFAGDDKVKCLRNLAEFRGESLLELPIFYVGGVKASASEIVCISRKECAEPERVYNMLGLTKKLFIPPEDCEPRDKGLEVVENVNAKVLKAAFKNENITKAALDYLCSLNDKDLSFKGDDINTPVTFTKKQIVEIARHKPVLEEFQRIALKAIKSIALKTIGQKDTLLYSADKSESVDLRDYLGIEDGEIPKEAARYFNGFGYRCVPIDCEKPFWFAACDVFVLSKKDAEDTFANFILDIDKNSNYAIIRKFKKNSAELIGFEKDSSVSNAEYLKRLREKRKSEKELLGADRYKKFINLINESGNNNLRFVNELLQNADDCRFADGAVPEFSLKADNKTMTTFCNEKGFERADVRAITDIGDSTKRILQDGGQTSAGEKGVGFKTIFSVAEQVAVKSNGFNFTLTDDEPTIPVVSYDDENNDERSKSGTYMRFNLKKPLPETLFKDGVIELCLCLRRLKKITLGGYAVEIKDGDGTRTITVNGEPYTFLKTEHGFYVTNPAALAARKESGKEITDNQIQRVCCYTYEGKSDKIKWKLYNVLPTEITLNIPMCIDAPFMLNTAREGVLCNNAWNEEILSGVYAAIEKTILAGKERLRAGVIKYIGVTLSAEKRPVCNIFSDEYFNRSAWTERIKCAKFLPTYDKNVYAAPCDRLTKRYPAPANYMLRKGARFYVQPAFIYDVPAEDSAELNALGVEFEKPEKVISEMNRYMRAYMEDKEFVKRLKRYLQEDCKNVLKYILRQLPVIPVYSGADKTDFICWQDDKIFIKGDESPESGGGFYILNESILTKTECEVIFGVTVNKMDFTYKKDKYQSELEKQFEILPKDALYYFVLGEYHSGNLKKYECLDKIKLKELCGQLPLKNVNGEIVKCKLFINDKAEYINGGIINRLSVHSECFYLAREAGCKDLFLINYDDISGELKQRLTADDIGIFLGDFDEYRGRELVACFAREHLIPEELEVRYNLARYRSDSDEVVGDNEDFPNNPVKNASRLIDSINKRWQNPEVITKQTKEYQVSMISYNGQLRDIDYKEIREKTMDIYKSMYKSKSGNPQYFCQMCGAKRLERHIKVNNIELLPRYYWEQTRLCLCLECSKNFEEIRDGHGGKDLIKHFKENILAADSRSAAPVQVKIDCNYYIMFTQTHLAEIQQILKLQDSDK